jgi:hypothetical protein
MKINCWICNQLFGLRSSKWNKAVTGNGNRRVDYKSAFWLEAERLE